METMKIVGTANLSESQVRDLLEQSNDDKFRIPVTAEVSREDLDLFLYVCEQKQKEKRDEIESSHRLDSYLQMRKQFPNRNFASRLGVNWHGVKIDGKLMTLVKEDQIVERVAFVIVRNFGLPAKYIQRFSSVDSSFMRTLNLPNLSNDTLHVMDQVHTLLFRFDDPYKISIIDGIPSCFFSYKMIQLFTPYFYTFLPNQGRFHKHTDISTALQDLGLTATNQLISMWRDSKLIRERQFHRQYLEDKQIIMKVLNDPELELENPYGKRYVLKKHGKYYRLPKKGIAIQCD